MVLFNSGVLDLLLILVGCGPTTAVNVQLYQWWIAEEVIDTTLAVAESPVDALASSSATAVTSLHKYFAKPPSQSPSKSGG